MSLATKAIMVRVAIPLLRILPFHAALFVLAALCDSLFGTGPKDYRFIVYASPLRESFYAPIIAVVWAFLALTPFILLRRPIVFRIYSGLFFGCLAFNGYDYLAGHPTFPPNEDQVWLPLVYAAPLLLAFVYRRYHVLWTTNA